jgi:hypothetical protein
MMITRNQTQIKTLLTLALAVMAIVALTAISARAATMSASPTAPAVDGYDIANYTHTGHLDKWFCVPGEWASMCPGQTFTTGSDPVKFSAITYQIADTQQAPPTKAYTIRVCTVDRVNPGDTSTWVLTEIYSEACIQDDFTVNNSEYMTWTLDTPVLLAANTEYGIDVGMNSSTSPWQQGISYIKYSNVDQYAGGTRYWSGWVPNQGDVIPGVGNETMVNVSGDRVFHLDLLDADPNTPSVDAGVDMITLSGMDVVLAPTVVNNDTEEPQKPLSYEWTTDAPGGYTVQWDPSNTVEAPTVTITPDTPGNPQTVTLTLKVDLVGTSSSASDTMAIDVYDDACLAAQVVSSPSKPFDPSDFDENCTTDLRDYAILAAAWLVDYALTAPVAKP